jgi:prepilin-type N-terminal cleavage/methylation domain-containing protein
MKQIQKKVSKRGFTLIEILIVIGIIAVLAAIVLVAINPARQFRQANNSQREANVNAILNAIGQYSVDERGDMTGIDINATADEISNSAVGDADICDDLVPRYLPALPTDPDSPEDGVGVDCGGTYESEYEVEIDADGRVTVCAPNTVDVDNGTLASDPICVTR